MTDFTPRTLTTERDELTGYDHGAHVTRWARDGVPVVWVSEQAHYERDQGIRGGVPVCWPWFASGPSGEVSPSHGFVRTARWHLSEHTQELLRWRLTEADIDGKQGADRFPHRFECEVVARLGQTLQVSLTVLNTCDSPFDYEAALHTYLHVGDVTQVRLSGLDASSYFDKVSGQDQIQRGDLLLTGETDRIYHSPGPVVVHDPSLSRELHISTEGAVATVVWNPWADKARGLADMADDEWRRMVCVEAGLIGDGRVGLGPGEQHTLTQQIAVQPAAAPSL